jgi:glutaredoxin-like protein NrdH
MMTAKEFDKLGIEYTKVDLTENPEIMNDFKEQGYLQAPIVTTDNKIWTGFRYDKIKALSHFLFGEKRNG